MWPEAYKIKSNNETLPCSIDGAVYDKENANVFYEKYNTFTLVCHTIKIACVISSL